jgi:TIR domain
VIFFGRLRVFISYARQDEKRADALYDSLKAAGFEPWMDRRDIPEGADWQAAIDRGIQRSHAFLACLSLASVQKSGVLKEEIKRAVERWKQRRWWSRLLLLPVRFEECQAPEGLARLQWVDVFRDADWVKVAGALRKKQRVLATASAAVVAALVLLVISLIYLGRKEDVLSAFRRPGGQPRIGVTVWKLEQAPPAPGSKELIHETAIDGTPEKDWKPLRAISGAAFHLGDHVRISLESGLTGYLYVVDREMEGADRMGVLKLVFPTTRIREGNNQIRPGAPIELPDQQDRPPYWTLKSSDPAYSGELITVFIVPSALKVNLERDAQQLQSAVFDKWLEKWKAPVVTAENTPAQVAATATELAAGTGSKTLTHEDPLPQTVYQKTGRNDGSIVVSFPIAVK